MWGHYYIAHICCWRFITCKRLEIRVEGSHFGDNVIFLLLKLIVGVEVRVLSLFPLIIVDGLWGTGRVPQVRRHAQVSCVQFTSQGFYLQLHNLSFFSFPSKYGGDKCRHSWNHILVIVCSIVSWFLQLLFHLLLGKFSGSF